MSDRVGLKPKDNAAAKKFSSLNLNQTYKGTKVEPKASTGAPRHGLQSLGKVASTRRMPPPANLPSLKSENLGNDPTVALVPSGGGGWGSGKETNTTTTTNKNATQGQTTVAQPQVQQPSKPTDISQKTTTGQQINAGKETTANQTSASTKTWASSSSSSVAGGQERTSYPHQSQYFNQEFPTLGGGNSKDNLPQEERASHHQYGHPPRNMHEPPWMDKGGSGPPPKPPLGMYNGPPHSGPAQRPGYRPQGHHRDGHPMNNHHQDFPYMGQSRPANYASHPAAAAQRGHPGSRIGGSMAPKHAIKRDDSPSGYVRPSIVKEEEIRAMDAEDVDDGGWAGAQEEIDYSVKLNFDDDEQPSPVGNDGVSYNQNWTTGPSSREKLLGERVVNGDLSRTQVDGKRPVEPRHAWAAAPADSRNIQPQRSDQGNMTQRPWPGQYPPLQQRNAYGMGPPPGPPNSAVGRPQLFDENRAGPTSGKPAAERSISIEQARQRKQMEEEERKRQQEAASREKLRLLDARTRPVNIPAHESSVRDQAGPRSPVSPAGSDTPVRRIMRRKDSGSIGDDDSSSVKSVESVGKDEKKITEIKSQVNKPRELRKSSSIELQENESKFPVKKNEDERASRDVEKKENVERKSSLNKDAKGTTVEKQKISRDVESLRPKYADNKVEPKLPAESGKDSKQLTDVQEKRPERKSSESKPRSDEALRTKSRVGTDELQDKGHYESRKENLDKQGSRLGSKNERGSSESVRSRDSIEKRKEDRRRPDDIKRKREDFERNEPLNEHRDRGVNKDRLYSSRGRPPIGTKSYLRGHPKSYSSGRVHRARNESKDYVDDEVKTIAAEEKGKMNEKTEERHWSGSDQRRREDDRGQFDSERQKPGSERPKPGGDQRQLDGSRRQRDGDRQQQRDGDKRQDDRRQNDDRRQDDRRQQDGRRQDDRRQHDDRRQQDGRRQDDRRQQDGRRQDDRRQQDGRRQANVDKHQRDGDRRDREKRDSGEDRNHGSDNRRKENQDSRFYNSQKRNEKDLRDDRSQYKGSGRFPSRGPADRAERFRDKARNRGGFGVPPKKRESEEKSKDEISEFDKTKPVSRTDSKKGEEQPNNVSEKGRANETEDWDDSEFKEVTKEVMVDSSDLTKKTTAEIEVVKPAISKDSGGDKNSGCREVEESSSSVIEEKKQYVNKEDKGLTVAPVKSNQNEPKAGERRERTAPDRDTREQNKNRNTSRSDPADTKRRESETNSENRRKQDQKVDNKRSRPRDDIRREQTKKNDDRKHTTGVSGEQLDNERDFKQRERKVIRDPESRFDERRDQKEHRTSDRGSRRENTSYRKDQRGERTGFGERTDRGERTDHRGERTETRDRRDPKEQGERTDRRNRTDQREREHFSGGVDARHRAGKHEQTVPKNKETVESNSDGQNKPDIKQVEQHKDNQQNNLQPEDEIAGKDSGKTEKQVDDFSSNNKLLSRFSQGSVSPVGDRRRYNESRRGGPSTRRGGRGGTRGTRGRGRGRLQDGSRSVGRSSITSKEDDDNDSEDFHSAHSSVDSDGSDSEEVFDKDEKRKDDHRAGRSYPSGSRTRGTYSSRGRGRGSLQSTRTSPRKNVERPPRFQRQDQARSASRGRGKSSRGGFSSKENWDENNARNKDCRTSDEGPLPKKRQPDSSYSNQKDSDSGYKGRKPIRGGQSGNRNSFLAKKQQEVVAGSSRKGGVRFGAKSTIPAALTTHGRRAKNELAPADGDENMEPPKKNPRRTEPQKTGIEHIDLSNIAGFIDIDDIAQPANEVEPASPQSDFVEVKSKRTQKEQRERAREEEDRKRRETDKMIQDALMVKPKTLKSASQNKQHTTSKPPRFTRNNGLPVSTLPGGNTPPRGVTPVASPENSSIAVLPSENVEQKRTSPLMLEKPSSPPPPPIFNAWTKPLSITPAKPPNEPSIDLSRIIQPDPLAVGSGKPQRVGGTHQKAEPELQIQLTLPDTFQAPPVRSTESRIFSRVGKTEGGESNTDSSLKKASDGGSVEQTENKEINEIPSAGLKTQKEDTKMNAQNIKTANSRDKSSSADSDKRQSTGNNWKSVRPPRFEKNGQPKRNTDGKKFKTDAKDTDGDSKTQVLADTEKQTKEKNDGRPRSTSRPRDMSKMHKAKPQVKTTKSQNSDENRDPNERNAQDKTGDEGQPNMNKRDSVELDVHSMSESLLDETPLVVHMVETSKAASGNPSMAKMKTEDDIKMDYELQEKMVAAKKAWDHSVSSSVSMQTSQWKPPVSDDENTESAEVSVVDQIPRPSPEAEESSEPLVTTPRLKKPTGSEQQNVCKVKPQQQQQPVKPQPVATEVTEEYASANVRPVLESQAPASYPVQGHPAPIFTSKPTQGYTYSFEQQALVPISHQYVQTDMSSIQQHRTPVRPVPQTLHAPSQSPPHRATTYPQGQSVSTPSPLSHQPLMQDTYRPLMQALYSTNTFAGNQFYPISVVRPAAPQFQASINDDINNPMYTIQAPKPQNQSHGYETALPAAQQVFLPVEQQPYPEFVQPQRQHPVGFYSDNQNQTSVGGMPAHVQKSVGFPPNDKQVQPQRDGHTPSGRQEQQQAYAPPGQSEMSKHVNAKPFQPPASSPSGSVAHPIAPNVRHVATASGQSTLTSAYHLNNSVLPMHTTGVGGLPGSLSSSDHTGTSQVVTQAHTLPVSRLNFHHFRPAVGSFPRQVQLPVQQLTQATYPAGLTYRAPVPTYPTTTSVANQPGVLVHKPAPMRQIVATGRGSQPPHRVPEPIQRPSKTAVFHPGVIKEKQINPQMRSKNVHQISSRRSFNPVSTAQTQVAAYQFQPLPRQLQPTQPQQQQQMFRSQQHKLMLSNVTQFFAEDKEIEHQRKQKQASQKREPIATTTISGETTTTNQQATAEDQRKQQPKVQNEIKQETKPQKSIIKDEQQKKRRQQIPDRRGVRTAQIPPQRNQNRPQSRSKPSGLKQEPVKSIQQVSVVTPSKSDTPKLEKVEANSAPLVN